VEYAKRLCWVFHSVIHNSVTIDETTGTAQFSLFLPPVYIVSAMSREPVVDSRQEMLRVAARLFQQQGYDATSMSDVAAALKLSKGGLYHHFQSKDEILFDLMTHALDITEARVIDPLRNIADPEQRLRTLIRLHVDLVMSGRDREITVLLHENHPLPPSLRKQINARKKEYIHFVETLIAEVQQARRTTRAVSARAATFALLGMINWIYQWYKPEGALNAEQIAQQYTEIFFRGAFS
jgi:AcrR family transcriptional regulator